MAKQGKHTKEIRKKLIDGIEKCIIELAVTKVEAANKLSVPVQTIHNNLGDLRCLNNVPLLTTWLEILTNWLEEKKVAEIKKTNELLEKIA